MIAVRICTTKDKIIENARWNIDDCSSIKSGSTIRVGFKTNDEKLISFLKNKMKLQDCLVFEEGKSLTLIMKFEVKEIDILLNFNEGGCSSMITLTPRNRNVENVVTYLFNKSECDGRFIKQVSEFSA